MLPLYDIQKIKHFGLIRFFLIEWLVVSMLYMGLFCIASTIFNEGIYVDSKLIAISIVFGFAMTIIFGFKLFREVHSSE